MTPTLAPSGAWHFPSTTLQPQDHSLFQRQPGVLTLTEGHLPDPATLTTWADENQIRAIFNPAQQTTTWLTPIRIRPCEPEDAPQAAGVVEQVFTDYGFTWDDSDYFQDLSELPGSYPDGFWVAEQDGRIVGVGGLELHRSHFPGPGQLIQMDQETRIGGTQGELVRLYVLASARRQGIARHLCECIMNEARHRQCHALEIWSDKLFQEAHQLYERLGAQRIGERICPDPDQSPEWGYLLPLNPA
ncbi:hypothetical protein CCB81_00100 [Armatimonadetes bacterium Uphvl-Ar2]|nr:hypothetical protein CCB81_00100 [Armatimonadetes bacterium Uphvl-Ar2]